MEYESAEVRRAREARRGYFSSLAGEVLKELESKSPAERREWHRETRGRFFFQPGDREERIRLLNAHVPGRKEEVIAAASRLLRHEFDILGSGPVSLGERIDWQRDFKSGTAWRKDVTYPAWNWRQVEDLAEVDIYRGHFYSIDDSSDLKVPWDLSSFFHLPTLGEAFLQTGDPRYTAELEEELRDWHLENPYPRGVNWTCAMVAGIRLANLAFVLRLIDADEFWGKAGLLSVLRHLKFILDFMEVDQDGRRNNHYLNNLVGLGFGAVEIAGSELGRELLDFVAAELEREVLTQFSPDGTNYEGTIPYHRFATESTVVTAILLESNGRRMGAECHAQLARMLRFIDFYTKPNGLAQQVGDNDNGRILVLHDYIGQEYRDHRHILAVGAAWLGLDGLQSDLTGQSPDVIWLLGKPAPAATGTTVDVLAGLYNHNGYAVAKADGSGLFIRCGRINPMSGGGHNHCDQLSFEFQDEGQDLIIDPGAMIYSADSAARNNFRSTAAHNVLQLDQLEQQEFNPRDLFSMKDRAAATVDAWEVEDEVVCFRGRHASWLQAGWLVLREIRCNLRKGTLQVCDRGEQTSAAPAGSEFCGRLHLAAGIEVELVSASSFLLRSGSREWRLHFSEGVACAETRGLVSPGYGVALPAAILEYHFPASASASANFVLERLSTRPKG